MKVFTDKKLSEAIAFVKAVDASQPRPAPRKRTAEKRAWFIAAQDWFKRLHDAQRAERTEASGSNVSAVEEAVR